MPKSMRNLLKYAHNETYVMPENAQIHKIWKSYNLIKFHSCEINNSETWINP
jgi:hypothetical protein